MATWYYHSQARDRSVLRQRMRELAAARPRFDNERIDILLTREGRKVCRKRVHRLYKLEGLQVRMTVRRRKRISLHRGRPLRPPQVANTGLWISFVTKWLTGGGFGC